MIQGNLPLISVVVPIYNTEKYLEQCIESILEQTYSNIEIILVDDGSTDESPHICDRYTQLYSNIRVIHQENKGAVKARRVGVAAANGEYVGFVDSDDWIAKQMYETLLENMNVKSLDIIAYGFTRPIESGNHYTTNLFADGIYEGENLEKIYTTMMYNKERATPGVNDSLCTKLIRKTILIECMYNVDEGITLGEDAAVVYHCFLKAKCVEIKNISPYFYRCNLDSVCHRRNIKLFEHINKFYLYMQKVYEDYDEKYHLLEQLNDFVIHFFQMAFKNNYSLVHSKAIALPKLSSIRVALYGAGVRGKMYYKEIMQDANIDLVAWVDKNVAKKMINDYQIGSVESLLHYEYDKIIIAVKSKEMADEIKRELIELGISSSKIVWEEMKYKKDVYWIEWE